METFILILHWACLITGYTILGMGAIMGTCEVFFFVLDKTLRSLGLIPVFFKVLNEMHRKHQKD